MAEKATVRQYVVTKDPTVAAFLGLFCRACSSQSRQLCTSHPDAGFIILCLSSALDTQLLKDDRYLFLVNATEVQ